MERARVRYTAADIRAGLVKEIVPAPGSNRFIVPFLICAVSSGVGTSYYSDSNVRLSYGVPNSYSGASLQLLPSTDNPIIQSSFNLQLLQTFLDEFGSSLSVVNQPLNLKPNEGITGGPGLVDIDLFYIVNTLT